MAECQMNTNPFVSMTTRRNVMMTSDNVTRHDNCYHNNTSDEDEDNNAMEAGEGVVEGNASCSNAQWVRLSKNLLLQLVERICMLSFQQVETTNSSFSSSATHNRRQYQADSDVISASSVGCDTIKTASSGLSPSAAAVLQDDSVPMAADLSSESPLSNTADQSPVDEESCHTKVLETGVVDGRLLAVTSGGDTSKRHPLRVTAQNFKSSSSSSSGGGQSVVNDVVQLQNKNNRTLNDNGGEEIATKENTHSPGGAVVGRSCSLARRRHRLNAARVMRRQRQRSRRRTAQTNRRHSEQSSTTSRAEHCATDLSLNRSLFKRQRQSWLALNKSLVLCALDRALTGDQTATTPLCDDATAASGSAKSAASSSSFSTRVAKSIWNPAVSLSRYEAHSATSADKVALQPSIYPVGCGMFPVGLWRGTEMLLNPFRMAVSSRGLQMADSSSNLATANSSNNSSLLCSLLGFEAPPASDVTLSPTKPVEYCAADQGATVKKQADSHAADKRQHEPTTRQLSLPNMTSPSSLLPFVPGRSKSPPATSREQEMTSSSSPYDVKTRVASGDQTARPLDYRNIKLQPTTPPSAKESGQHPPGCIGDKWIVLDKGDVSSLVESLVNTMIASGAPSEKHVNVSPPAHSINRTITGTRHISSNEPRKWKSNLLQRLRTETQ